MLSLHVMCDCENWETAELVARPMLALPRLRDCTLRLAACFDEQIQGLARCTVAAVTDHNIPQSVAPFRFIDLPPEIQLTVLGYTSLGSEYTLQCMVEWTEVRYNYNTWTGYDLLLTCACRSGHSAFNSQCKCSRSGSREALFLVSRNFHNAGLEIFYGRTAGFDVNMVDMVATGSGKKAIIIPGHERFPRGAIQHLTCVRLNFPKAFLTTQQPCEVWWKHWLDTISWFAQEANLPRLRIELRLSEQWFVTVWDVPPLPDLVYERNMDEAYNALVLPMVELKGLKDFYVHLNYKTSCGHYDRRMEIEARLEKMVMGEDYDSWEGKQVAFDPSLYR
jgi:hypothetical protein